MEIGMFTQVWKHRGLDAILSLMTGYGVRHTQFAMSHVGLAPMPKQIPSRRRSASGAVLAGTAS